MKARKFTAPNYDTRGASEKEWKVRIALERRNCLRFLDPSVTVNPDDLLLFESCRVLFKSVVLREHVSEEVKDEYSGLTEMIESAQTMLLPRITN